MNKVPNLSGRVYDSFNSKVGIRRGWYNFFCYSLGMVGGLLMRDELLQPNLQKTDDIINHWHSCENLTKLDIDEVNRKLNLSKKTPARSSSSKPN